MKPRQTQHYKESKGFEEGKYLIRYKLSKCTFVEKKRLIPTPILTMTRIIEDTTAHTHVKVKRNVNDFWKEMTYTWIPYTSLKINNFALQLKIV